MYHYAKLGIIKTNQLANLSILRSRIATAPRLRIKNLVYSSCLP
jgi:hypothetical protein